LAASLVNRSTSQLPPPAKFEAGTGNIADAVGLGAAIDYLDRVGMANVRKAHRNRSSRPEFVARKRTCLEKRPKERVCTPDPVQFTTLDCQEISPGDRARDTGSAGC
jgi:selenocysteine lyase/cysteine desulfurase